MDKDSPFGDFSAKFQFLNVSESKLNNVNKGGWKANKHTELWAKELFDDRWRFQGYDM